MTPQFKLNPETNRVEEKAPDQPAMPLRHLYSSDDDYETDCGDIQDEYDNKFASLRSYPVAPGSEWPEGGFEEEEMALFHEILSNMKWVPCAEVTYNSTTDPLRRIVAFPVIKPKPKTEQGEGSIKKDEHLIEFKISNLNPKENPTTYEIKTLQDIGNCITNENLAGFIKDLEICLASFLLYKALIKEGIDKGEVSPDTEVTFPSMKWIDDWKPADPLDERKFSARDMIEAVTPTIDRLTVMSIDKYTPVHSRQKIESILTGLYNNFLQSLGINLKDNESPKCTCRDDQKQRAICPVCDKEEYEKITACINREKEVKDTKSKKS
jgi:hypothetical protein